MRELVVGAGCVLGLLAVLWLLSGLFDTSARQPAHAMELAHVRAEANAARAEAEQAKADLEKVRAELKAAAEALAAERQKVADLEKRLAAGAKGGATQAAPAPATAGR
jgi:predicted  nucleic acid-binding Zn-ribbon protein